MKQEAAASHNSSVIPFLIGGVVGAAIGILFAPRSGSETRKQLKDLASGARNKVSSTIVKGMDIYDDARLAVSSAVEAGKQAYIQEREKIQTAD